LCLLFIVYYKTALVQMPFMTLGQEIRWSYSNMITSPQGCEEQDW